jgi:glycosyltransferase involved in cell wall biosynthesis
VLEVDGIEGSDPEELVPEVRRAADGPAPRLVELEVGEADVGPRRQPGGSVVRDLAAALQQADPQIAGGQARTQRQSRRTSADDAQIDVDRLARWDRARVDDYSDAPARTGIYTMVRCRCRLRPGYDRDGTGSMARPLEGDVVRLSVVVPTYNSALTLPAQLEALAAQVWEEPWEVVVVDNGSADDSLEVAKEWAGSFPAMTVETELERQGVSAAKNTGARYATGEYVAFVDSDDVVGDGWLAAIGEAVMEHDFVVGALETSLLNEPFVERSRRFGRHEVLLDVYGFLPFGCGCNMAVLRSIHDEVGGFDETLPYAQDTDYCWRIQLAGHALAAAPEAVLHYRYRTTVGEIFRQASNYGFENVALHKRYLPLGLARPSSISSLKGWARIVAQLPRALNRQGRLRLAWMLGFKVGRLRGAVRSRFLVW